MVRYGIGILLFFSCFVSKTMQAQYYDQVIGLRAGTSFELSYKRFVAYYPQLQQAIEGLAGFQLDESKGSQNGYVLEVLYHVHLDVGFDTNVSAFAGGGGYMGLYNEVGQPVKFGGGATLAIGIAYNFTHTPLNVAIDWKPIFGWPRLSLTRGAISLRYIIRTTWQ